MSILIGIGGFTYLIYKHCSAPEVKDMQIQTSFQYLEAELEEINSNKQELSFLDNSYLSEIYLDEKEISLEEDEVTS